MVTQSGLLSLENIILEYNCMNKLTSFLLPSDVLSLTQPVEENVRGK